MFLFNYSTLIDPLLREIRDFTPVFAGMQPGEKVLDVCCGTGAQVIAYGRRGIHATGIDNDPGMLQQARRNQPRRHTGNISFLLADAARLPFPDACFDHASISFGLHEKRPAMRSRVLNEMKRVVRRGGGLVFVDYRVPLPDNIPGLAARIIEFLAGGEHHRGFQHYLKNGGLPALLRQHRLQELRRAQLMGGLAAAFKAICL